MSFLNNSFWVIKVVWIKIKETGNFRIARLFGFCNRLLTAGVLLIPLQQCYRFANLIFASVCASGIDL